ncbi:RrF2 family transcriptional regulator [Gloeothece verrucosa]|uniref:Transcriptional regulator, BadM/Rrf2 family n=1 Tax=Gloeothece verrucosa (strain PCC 7822) TaxID=497965 RepID=E0U6D0_GLOV7|nr:Rrf2 family transcriptional regulator [Gloeothece verrucosa]ADN13573.1 transcriptional regulator, BadM/Rrf2 family [Gloeothece verrucosa PCC 7822]
MQSQISAQKPLFSLDLPLNVKYALLVLLELVTHPSASIDEMATKYLISKPYLEWICANLQRGGLIDKPKEAEEIYALNFQPKQITLLDVVRAIETQANPVMGFETYSPDRRLIHQIWHEVRTAAQNTLQQYTLEDLCQKPNAYDWH